MTWLALPSAREASNTTGPWRPMVVNLDAFHRAITDPADDDHTLLLAHHAATTLTVDEPLERFAQRLGVGMRVVNGAVA